MQENKIKNLLENIDLQINFLTEDLTTVTAEKAQFETNAEGSSKRTKAYKNKANELKLQEDAIYSQIYFFEDVKEELLA
jgi:RNase H-fold protein (predicted Holliday junction resolvase)